MNLDQTRINIIKQVLEVESFIRHNVIQFIFSKLPNGKHEIHKYKQMDDSNSKIT